MKSGLSQGQQPTADMKKCKSVLYLSEAVSWKQGSSV